MSNKLTYLAAGALLLTLFLTAFFSMVGDSLTFDELAHIPGGYSYLTQRDYRVNPEHPPLIKDLSAVPLLFKDLTFPADRPVWTQEESAPPWWVQFDLGTEFIYKSGNNPTDIIVWARLPMILLLVFLGWFLFRWARELGGNLAGLGALALIAFSPSFIAHGRLVTTDVGAGLGAVMGLYFWLKFLKNPKPANVFLAGIFFGIAMLMKFSLILLIPLFAVLVVAYPGGNLKKYLLKALIAGAIGLFLVIWPVYQFHIAEYPADHQVRDTVADLAPNKTPLAKNLTVWMADKPLLRPFAQYFRGVLMATQRTSFGNTTYFMGEISADAWWYYFPVIYFLKVPLALHLLTLVVLAGLLYLAAKQRRAIKLKEWLKENFHILSFFLFIFIYWVTAMRGNLNIGVRHLLPTFPFIYLLLILGLKKILFAAGKRKTAMGLLVSLIFAWYIFSGLAAFPNYISYYNEAAGGAKNGHRWAVDSNYDWGQDFYRLRDFVENNNIQKIYLDYFGGENPTYWLGEKYIKLDPKEIQALPTGWVAVSFNQFQGGVAKPVPGFDQQTGYYEWLANETPVGRAGYSIVIYNIRE
ncbi:MAG: glycosyltransferase family 39 protein [Candidatus Nealsonbacteria bacterium]|nr:glycosyltransferase family 39 protein [Candidatus Nealsonbacteria bacterium]